MRILSVTAIGFLALIGCSKLASAVLESYNGDGTIVKDARTVTAFHAVEFDGGYEIVLTQGPTTDVRIETDKNLLEHITTEVKDGKLIVESHGNLNPTKSITVYITSPDYSAIEVDGAGHVTATTPIKSNDLALGISGSGHYELELHVNQLKSEIAGSGTLDLKGDAANHRIDISGSGKILAKDLHSDSTNIDIAGSGNTHLNVAKYLAASISGSGNVRYSGAVTDVHSNIEGSGNVERE
jgi:hypothetical protein